MAGVRGWSGLRVVLLACLLIVSSSASAAGAIATPGQAGASDARDAAVFQLQITDVTLTGPGVIHRKNGTTYVWQSDSKRVHVQFDRTGSPADYRVCLSQRVNDSVVREFGCKMVTPGDDSNVTFDVGSMEAISREHSLVANVSSTGGDIVRIPVRVLSKHGDPDGDGLVNEREINLSTNVTGSDTDADGLSDGAEVTQYGTDPTSPDTDGDGLRDAVEIEGRTDPLDPDTDSDGLRDGWEADHRTNATDRDTDGDGLWDGTENSLGTNPTNPDSDGDGIRDRRELGIGTDPTDSDTDGDGLSDATERRLGTDPTGYDYGLWFVALLAALLVAGALGVAWRRLGGGLTWPMSPPTPDGGDDVPSSTTSADGNPEDAASDPSLRTREERVRDLLTQHGGRMRQADIVESTEWSKATVSRLLSDMEEEGELRRVQIGRGNVVLLPDEPLERSGNDTDAENDGARDSDSTEP